MAGCDYRFCDVCNKRAYYDTDVDYNSCEVIVLCEECAKEWIINITSKLIPEELKDEMAEIKKELHDLRLAWLDIKQQLEMNKNG